MLVIYDKTTTSFDNLGIGVLRDFKTDPLITEVLNGLYNLEFEYACNGWLNEYLVEENIIKANGQPFRIWNVKKNVDKNTIIILAKHIFFDTEKSVWLEDVAPTNLTAQSALQWCLNRAKDTSQYTSSGDCTNEASARYVRTNLIDAVYNNDNAILKRFGGEIELDNYNVIFHNRRGSELGLEIRQKKNLQGADYELDFTQVATRIMPIGNDGLLLPERYIDSPHINNYFSPLYYKYECDIGIDEEEGITDEIAYQMMRNEVYKLFADGIDKPSINIKINFIELSKTIEYMQYMSLETAHLGDSCKIYIPSLKLNLTTRIVKTVYNCLKKRIISLELGSIKPNISSSKIKNERAIKNALSSDNNQSFLQKAKDLASHLINHPFGGRILINETTGELLIMDTNDPRTAQKVWKWGLGGLGFSSTGINGPYSIAMTQNGSIVADFITSGQINTNLIQGYEQLVTAVENIPTITTEDNAIGTLSLSNLMKNKLICLKVHPTDKDIIALVISNSLKISSTLKLATRTITISGDETFKYKIPRNLYRYNNEIYDEFVYDGVNERIYIIHRVSVDTLGNKSILATPIEEDFEYYDMIIGDGDNDIYMKGYPSAYIYAKAMIKNDYTSSFATSYETNTKIQQVNKAVEIIAEEKIDKNSVIADLNVAIENHRGIVRLRGNSVIIDSDKFDLDEHGNVSILGGNIYLGEGSQILGDDGLMSTILVISNICSQQFVGGSTLLPMGFSEVGADQQGIIVSKDWLSFEFNIPEDFVIKSAKITLSHVPVNYTGYTTATGYCRKLKLYKSSDGLNQNITLNNMFYYFVNDNTGYTEVQNAFGQNGFTGNPSSGSEATSIELKDYITTGFNKFKVQSDETTPTTSLQCYQYSGACMGTLYITGYSKFEEPTTRRIDLPVLLQRGEEITNIEQSEEPQLGQPNQEEESDI